MFSTHVIIIKQAFKKYILGHQLKPTTFGRRILSRTHVVRRLSNIYYLTRILCGLSHLSFIKAVTNSNFHLMLVTVQALSNRYIDTQKKSSSNKIPSKFLP